MTSFERLKLMYLISTDFLDCSGNNTAAIILNAKQMLIHKTYICI